ncbi:MAG: divalent-cation tolerance protein CutA [Oligoflexia bacterium]|nr:divalent-cation tolerance protein CutA [Oligoflexia bacterium]
MSKKSRKTRATKQQKSFLIFFTTFSQTDHAHQFARRIVQARLAACINVIPGITSHYTWNNQLRADAEILLIGKTTPKSFAKIKKQIREFHTYSVPELIGIRVADGAPDYLKWVAAHS